LEDDAKKDDVKDYVSKEIQRIDTQAGAGGTAPTPFNEEHLRHKIPPFHSDPDKIREYHGYLLLRNVEICNWCDWRHPDHPIEHGPSFNGVDLEEWKKRVEDAALYGSWSGKREQRVNEYFRGRQLGLTHGDIRGIMGRRMNVNTLDDYREVYEQWKSSEEAMKRLKK